MKILFSITSGSTSASRRDVGVFFAGILSLLQVNGLVLVRTDIDRVIDPVDDVTAVAGQQRGDVDVPLLQLFVWIELIESAEQLAVGRLVSRHLRAVKARTQSFELIVDFPASGFQRVSQRRINAAQLLAQLIELAGNHSLGFGKRVRRLRAQVLLYHALQNTLRPGKQIGQL